MNSAGTVSLARACPWVAAPIVTRPGPNDNWTGVPRSATSDTRRTASVNASAGRSAVEPNSSGNRDRYLMNSPASSLVVSRRSPASKPIMASAPSGASLARSMIRTGSPGVIMRPASASVLAGTSIATRACGAGPGAGVQSTSRIASR